MHLHIFENIDELLSSHAAYFIAAAKDSIAADGHFSVALSGGSSPKKLFELLASEAYKNEVEWEKVFFFFGDERYVPHIDAESNYLMVKNALFEPLQIKPEQIFAVNTMLAPADAARDYMLSITNFFGESQPTFSLVLLGMGDDSHTASLFPGTPVLGETEATVKEVFLQNKQIYRITLTAPLINMAQRIAFLVYGSSKANAVYHVMKSTRDTNLYPAQLIAPVNGRVDWFIDNEAAALIQHT